jgi:hypothetical protein
MQMSKSRAIAIPMCWAFVAALFFGCQQDRMNNIPPSATLASSGNSQLTYTAQSDGTVWIYDVNNDRIDYSGSLRANQSIVVDSTSRQITVDGRIVSDKAMNSGAEHRIYFKAMMQ